MTHTHLSMREILRNKHFIVVVDEAARVVRRTRTEARFESMEELAAAYDELLRVLDSVHRASFGQLVDARPAPPRNDPAFEAAVARYHPRLYAGFRATAVLVQSAAGRLQVRRMLDASGVESPVFVDEAAALMYLSNPATPGTPA
jgi:hypothetical protein